MENTYDYRALLQIIKGGYPGEPHGVIPDDTSWHTATPSSTSMTRTYTYYYRDSVVQSTANSSRVNVNVEDTWTATLSDDNYLTVTVNSRVLSITRDDVRGTPNPSGVRFNIYIRREKNGGIIKQFLNDNINTAHTISGAFNLGTYTFTLPPGQSAQRGTVYLFNDVVGSNLDDEMWMGISFRNNLPPGYRPGKVLAADGTWYSTNRRGGKCHIRKADGTLKELRSSNGGVGTTDPPFIADDNGVWHNQRKIGQQ